MPRAMRVEYPGAIYHVMNRGDRQEDLFVDDVDPQDLLKTLAEACRKTDWQVHAYCLMRNHFHLVLETPNANLVEGMRWFLNAYTIRLNRRQKLFGHVLSGCYKALLVEGSGNGYLKTACDYVHLNPVRAHLLGSDERLLACPWSSFGCCLGSEEFRQKMLGLMEGKLGDNHSGELRRETAEQKANRIISEERLSRGWKESDLTARSRSDRGKLAIAARLRNETILPIKWIAARVHIGTAKGAKTVLHQLAHGHHQRKPASTTERCAQLEFQSTV